MTLRSSWRARTKTRVIDGFANEVRASRAFAPMQRNSLAGASMPNYQHVKVPTSGTKIAVKADGGLTVPNDPIIPYIEGDGTGVDITPVMLKVVDAAVAKAYGGKRRIHWMEVFAGEK